MTVQCLRPYFHNADIDGFNPAKQVSQSVAVMLGGSERGGAIFYHSSEGLTGVGALMSPVTATTGLVSWGTRNPMTRQYGELTYGSTRFEQAGRGTIMINIGSGASKVNHTLQPEVQ